MTILQEILNWSKSLPVWQQDAISRLYAERNLTDVDIEDLYALAKMEVGIPDLKGRAPKILQGGQIPSQTNPSRLIQLLGIKNTINVNALAEDGKLPFSPIGLTIIYGENGSGKSGYSRVFKHACRARDQSEAILPNVQLDPSKTGVPEAIFEVMVDGVTLDLKWVYQEEPPGPLSEISIFDTHCARAYIDNQGDFTYKPYGLDILEGLVNTCNKLKLRATQEKEANKPVDSAYAFLTHEPTTVAKFLQNIPNGIKPSDIEGLATLLKPEQERLAVLNKTLIETDPKQKAQALRQRGIRLKELKDRVAAAISAVSEPKINELRSFLKTFKAAKSAAELAAAEFKNNPKLLPGTGGEEWKILFEAARAFASLSHSGHKFPNIPPESPCPLCQNQVGAAGIERLIKFDAFITQTTETAAKTARVNAETAYRAIQQKSLDFMFGKALNDELVEIDPTLASQLPSLQATLIERQKAILLASAEKLPWEQIPQILTDPQDALTELILKCEEQTKVLEASVNEKARALLISERQELNARHKLSEIKTLVLEAIDKHALCRKLQACIDSLDTRGISRKSTDLSRSMASQELANTLNEELKQLKVHDLQVVMKPESPGGKTQFKLTLQLPGGGTPSAILSEGEQRAIAIASFLAELKLGKGTGGIVFDDPVSSLDHRRREEVANRLAKESLLRQVIIFTHDIYFLCILEQKAEKIGATLAKNYIRQTQEGFGVNSDSLPFDIASTKYRIQKLFQMLPDIYEAHKRRDEECFRQIAINCYMLLRLAWERCVEEVLFNESIQRFGEGISTNRLKTVTVTYEDYQTIDEGMTKCSRYTHDAAIGVGRIPIPEPDGLREDIEKLETFRKAIIKRREEFSSK